MSLAFPSAEWVGAYGKAINASDGYRVASLEWTHGAVALVVNRQPDIGIADPVGIWLDLERGVCRTAKVVSQAEWLAAHEKLLAKEKKARFLLASTSEVYGDPQVHPQKEDYWGNVNPIGPRGVYDEAKRFAEAITMAYHRTHRIDTRIVRIFNTFGPRMRLHDGRAIPAFISQALTGAPLTVFL